MVDLPPDEAREVRGAGVQVVHRGEIRGLSLGGF